MKKIISLLAAVMLIMSLTACGDTSGGEGKEPVDVSTGNDAGTGETQQTKQPEAKDVTIEEAVLVDDAGVKITAKSLESEELFGAEVKLLIENNSGKDLTFQCRNVSVNGYMVETMFSADVVNGKKANDAITFLSSDLENCGIDVIADMDFSFHIFTTDGWEKYLDTPQVQIQTSAASTYQYTFDDSGDLAYDENGVKVVIKGLAKDDSLFGPGIVVYIENSSEKPITVQTRDVSVNGFMVDAMFSSDVMPGKHAVDTITFLSTELEENAITEIQNVELLFHIFNLDSGDLIADTDTVKMAF